ncbi:DUF1707 SHOCT-like domain-containing protein [Streptomyces sp. NPDC002004]
MKDDQPGRSGSDGTGGSAQPAVADLRASDADRDRVVETLRDALAEGRLDMEEFEERLEATYKARTYGELAPITRDLPAGGASAAPVSMVKTPSAPAAGDGWSSRIGGAATSTMGIAIMSGFERKGRWTVPRRFDSFAFWGGGEIDLREAQFEDREVVINCVAIMGGLNVVVPPGVEVVVRGLGIMGGFDHPRDDAPIDPGAPRVIVTGLALMGGVGVQRKVTRAEKQRLREERRRERVERREARRTELENHRADRREAHQERRMERREAAEERRREWRDR